MIFKRNYSIFGENPQYLTFFFAGGGAAYLTIFFKADSTDFFETFLKKRYYISMVGVEKILEKMKRQPNGISPVRRTGFWRLTDTGLTGRTVLTASTSTKAAMFLRFRTGTRLKSVCYGHS
jgi:hypothetical protein